MDALRLNGIEVECILGDLPEERVVEQRILVDVALELDLQEAALSDSLNDTVDYALLVGNIREALEEARCRLLERAADVVADVCLADPRVEHVTVSVRKFGSVSGLGSAEVKITRPV
ncbi:MAG: dihydroneopterin aldolase [Kiritimatiellia bacterium]